MLRWQSSFGDPGKTSHLLWSLIFTPFVWSLEIKQLLLCSISISPHELCFYSFARNFLIPKAFLILSPSNLWLPTSKLGSQASHPLLEQILCNPKNSINLGQVGSRLSCRCRCRCTIVQLYTSKFRRMIVSLMYNLHLFHGVFIFKCWFEVVKLITELTD